VRVLRKRCAIEIASKFLEKRKCCTATGRNLRDAHCKRTVSTQLHAATPTFVRRYLLKFDAARLARP